MNKLDIKKQNTIYIVLLSLIILIGCIRLTYLFSLRDGHHVDETWTYSFANSYYNTPVIDGADATPDLYTGKWIEGAVFNDFISVSEEHRFSFDAVMHNKKDDLSPALYALILHLVSSFFPGVFSWGFAFAINLLFYIPTIVLVYIISKEFTHSDICGLVCSAFYIFSGCCMGNYLYLRVYSLFTFLTVLTLWLFIRIYKKVGKQSANLALLVLTALLGSFTHYYYLVIAFFFTAFTILALLLKKQLKTGAAVGSVMLCTELVYLLIYQPARKVFLPFTGRRRSVTGGINFPYSMDLSVANIRFFNGSVGFYIPFSYGNVMYFLGAVAFAAITVFLIFFLFRNENWMKKAKVILLSACKKIAYKALAFFKSFDMTIYVAMLSAICYLLIIPISANIINMGFVERYFFPAMTVFSIAFISIISKIIIYCIESNFKKSISIFLTVAVSLVLVLLSIRSNMYVTLFRFRDMHESELRNEVSGKDCYVIVSTLSDLLWLSPIINESNNVYVDLQKSFDGEMLSVPSLDDDDVLLFVRTGLISDEDKEALMADPENYEIYIASYGNSKCPSDILQIIEDESGVSFSDAADYSSFIGDIGIYTGESSGK